MQKILAAAAILLPLLIGAPAKAQTYYPWCAVYGSTAGGASNCGFVSFRQCMATVSGMGGFCQRNPFYDSQAEERRARRYR